MLLDSRRVITRSESQALTKPDFTAEAHLELLFYIPNVLNTSSKTRFLDATNTDHGGVY